MTRTHRILLPMMLLGIATALPASAASLGGIDTPSLTAGQATVNTCDGAFAVSYTTQGGDITAVTVGGIADPACEHGSLTVQVLGADGNSISSAAPVTLTADADAEDNSVTLPLSPQPKADQVHSTAVSISGP